MSAAIFVLAGASGASASPAAAARPRLATAPTWLRPAATWELPSGGVLLGRTLPPRPSASRRRSSTVVRNPGNAPYAFFDLGTPPGLFAPIPYAIDAHGDATVQFCATPACAPGATSAYVFDRRLGQMVPLGRFDESNVGYTPYAIDAAGDRIVGWATFVSGYTAVDRPVQWTRTSTLGSRIAFLDADPHVVGRAYGISHAGKAIVGTVSTDPHDGGAPATFGNGGFVLLPTGSYTDGGDAFVVNDAGVVAGDLLGSGGIFTADTFEFFAFLGDDPPVDASEPVAIAENGDVAGNFVYVYPGYLPLYPVGYRYHRKLGPPRAGVESIYYGGLTYVSDMNDEDDLVGETYPDRYATYVGPYLDGTPLDDLLPATDQGLAVTATAINDANDIVGQAYDANYALSAFEMVPVPPGCTPTRRPACLGMH